MVNPTGYTALDLIGFTDQGAYSSSDNYVKNDLVHYNGNIWRCLIDDTSGIAPAEGVNWTLFIGEPTNLVERIIAPVETDPATNAWAVGRQIIYNDKLYEVITAITAGDSLVAYEDDPTNANIKLADPVETQLLNVKGNLSNRNLLDNAWFTVNQRGQSSYSNVGYTVDRWTILDAHGTIAPSSNGLIFTATDSTLNLSVRQFIEVPSSMLEGKPITLSIKLSDGTLIQGTAIYKSNNSPILSVENDLVKAVLYNYPTINGQFINLTKLKGDTLSVTVRAIKLELGSVSTLAMDTTPNYAEELLKCQRYFNAIRTSDSQNDWFAIGLVVDKYCEFVLNIPPMRTVPSVTYNNLYVSDGRVPQKAVISVRTIHADSNNQRIHFPVNIDDSSVYSEDIIPVGLWGGAGGNSYIYLSADL